MKKAHLTLCTLLAVFSLTLGYHFPARSSQPEPDHLPTPASIIEESILASTLQIIAYPGAVPDGMDENVLGVYECGLASFVQVGEQSILVSHDHWVDLESFARVEFLDSGGALLVEVSGTEFRGLIRYQDEGTMLLSAPAELSPAYQALMAARKGSARFPLIPGVLGDSRSVQTGRVVSIAYRRSEGRGAVSLMQARIRSISEFEGKPIIKLQSLGGSAILPGDSGGGIWLEGTLIGNMWMSEWVYDWRIWIWEGIKPAVKYLDTSIAARFPQSFPSTPSISTETADSDSQFSFDEDPIDQ